MQSWQTGYHPRKQVYLHNILWRVLFIITRYDQFPVSASLGLLFRGFKRLGCSLNIPVNKGSSMQAYAVFNMLFVFCLSS